MWKIRLPQSCDFNVKLKINPEAEPRMWTFFREEESRRRSLRRKLLSLAGIFTSYLHPAISGIPHNGSSSHSNGREKINGKKTILRNRKYFSPRLCAAKENNFGPVMTSTKPTFPGNWNLPLNSVDYFYYLYL